MFWPGKRLYSVHSRGQRGGSVVTSLLLLLSSCIVFYLTSFGEFSFVFRIVQTSRRLIIPFFYQKILKALAFPLLSLSFSYF